MYRTNCLVSVHLNCKCNAKDSTIASHQESSEFEFTTWPGPFCVAFLYSRCASVGSLQVQSKDMHVSYLVNW